MKNYYTSRQRKLKQQYKNIYGKITDEQRCSIFSYADKSVRLDYCGEKYTSKIRSQFDLEVVYNGEKDFYGDSIL